jgi:NADH:ubiquinone oxidoreductase subunit
MAFFKSIARFLGALSPAHITLVTLLSGATKVGTDAFGNIYYRAKARAGYKHERRWVIYKGEPEATAVPPDWHGWLHHQTDEIPGETQSYRRAWQKPHVANLTGTKQTYLPPGHLLKGGRREAATGDYEAWKPE